MSWVCIQEYARVVRERDEWKHAFEVANRALLDARKPATTAGDDVLVKFCAVCKGGYQVGYPHVCQSCPLAKAAPK